jgi:hypothetical protein
MPKITLDDMLIVAAEVKLVALADQASRQQLIDGLADPDKKIMLELAKRTDPPATLKDFLLLRAKESPTQSLAEIMNLLSHKEPQKIDRDHLLLNLIHAHQNGLLEPEDIATLMRHYVTLTALAAGDPSLSSIEFVDCLASEKPGVAAALSPAIIAALAESPMLSQSKQQNIEWIRINAPRYPILQQAIAYTHPDFADTIATQRLGGNTLQKKGADEKTIYTAPLTILSEIYSKTCNVEDQAVAALPVFGCYSFEHLQKYSCGMGDVEYRPVTLPTYLPKNIRALFYGTRANGLGEVVYDLYSADPDLSKHFLDMQRAHSNKVGHFGVMNHDDFHLIKANIMTKNDVQLRDLLLGALNDCLQEAPLDAATHKLYQALLDDGIGLGFLSTGLRGNDEQFDIFSKVLNKITAPDFKKLLSNAIMAWIKNPTGNPDLIIKYFGKKGENTLEFLNGQSMPEHNKSAL